VRPMRGPLLSGAIGSPATLRLLVDLVRGHAPIAVIGPPWLAEKLQADGEVAVLAAEGLAPIAPGSLGAVMVENLGTRAIPEVVAFLLRLAELIRPGGKVLALDRTKDLALQAQLTTAFLAAGFGDIRQARPRAGALVTSGVVPDPRVRQVLAAGPIAPAPGSAQGPG
jgi:hypothetical protein